MIHRKTTLIVVVVVCALLGAHTMTGQTFEPQPVPLLDTSSIVNSDFNEFQIGWNWGDVPTGKMNQVLGTNYWHGGSHKIFSAPAKTEGHRVYWAVADTFENQIGIPGKIDQFFERLAKDHNLSSVVGGHSISYFASVDVDSSRAFAPYDDGTHGPDNSGSAFGFEDKKNGTMVWDSDYSRYTYRLSHQGFTTPDTALANPWPNDEIYRFNDPSTRNDEFNGRKLVLSITLRRSDVASNAASNTSPVVSIKVPYTLGLGEGGGHIEFSQKPSTSVDTTGGFSSLEVLSALGDSVGKIWPMSTATGTEVVITADMIPQNGCGGTGEFVTFSAEFLLIDQLNPLLQTKPRNKADSEMENIHSLDILVTYHGNVSVDIDNVRFASPNAVRLHMGEYDEIIRDYVQDDIETFHSNLDSAGNGAKIQKVYNIDEPAPSQWGLVRYYNNFLDGYTTTEVQRVWRKLYDVADTHDLRSTWRINRDYSKHFERITGIEEAWTEALFDPIDFAISPYIQNGYNHHETGQNVLDFYNYGRGWGQLSDSTKIDYDTYVKGNNMGALKSSDDYLNLLPPERGVQNMISFRNESERFNAEFLFSDQPYIANPWLYSKWEVKFDSNAEPYSTKTVNRKPKTAEELRSIVWGPVILGAKGIMYFTFSQYWSDWNKAFQANEEVVAKVGVSIEQPEASLQAITDETQYLKDDRHGADFLKWDGSEYLDLDKVFDGEVIQNNLGVDSNRFYLGRMSQRLEMKKMHDQFKIMGSTLLNLKLQAWFSRAFLEDGIVNERTGSEMTTWGTMFDPNDVRLYPYGSQTAEHLDSTFVELTFHKHKNESTDTVMYFGILNRRCDPVVHTTLGGGTPVDPNDATAKFYTGAEFDSLVSGGYIGEYAQIGARDIVIPFDYSDGSGLYHLLHVSELGTGNSWLVGQDEDFRMSFRPGEGKMLRVKVLPVDTNTIGGLAHSNQRKLIHTQGTDTTNRYYHMVYQREVVDRGDTNLRVFYRRSLVTENNSSASEIDWEDTEIPLSDAADSYTGLSPEYDCGYPSITALDDKVYVVFAGVDKSPMIPRGKIIEAVFDAYTDYSTLTLTQSEIAEFNGTDLEHWGTPTIGAVNDGLVYAWADENSGIVYNAKGPADQNFMNSDKSLTWFTPTASAANHPSINTFSRLNYDENDVALVWQEKRLDLTYQQGIFYSRLWFDPNSQSVEHIIGSLDSSHYRTEWKDSIIMLSSSVCDTLCFPMVTRAVESANYVYLRDTLGSIVDSVPVDIDHVVWQRNTSDGRARLYKRALFSVDGKDAGEKVPGSTRPYNALIVRSKEFDLHQPNNTVGKLNHEIRSDSNGYANTSNTAGYVDFVVTEPSESPTHTASIANLPYSHYWAFGSNENVELDQDMKLTTSGRYPQLTISDYVQDDDVTYRKRRVLEFGAESKVVSSSENLAKLGYAAGFDVNHWYTYAFTGCISQSVKSIRVDDMPTALVSNSEDKEYELEVGSSTYTYRLPTQTFDTLVFDTFSVDDSTYLEVEISMSDTTDFRVDVVKNSNGTRWTLPLLESPDTTVALIRVQLYNGGGEDFHVEAYTLAQDVMFIDDVLIGDLPYYVPTPGSDTSSINFKSSHELERNLNLVGAETGAQPGYVNVHVFPNPVHTEVTIKTWKTVGFGTTGSQLDIEVVDLLGNRLFESTVISGAEVRLNTTNFPAGMYYVHVREQGSSTEAGSTTVRFVKE